MTGRASGVLACVARRVGHGNSDGPRPASMRPDYVRLGGRIVNSSEHYHPVCAKSTKMRLGIARIQCGLYFNRKFGEHPRPPLNERSQLNDVMVRRGEACLALAGVASHDCPTTNR